MNIRHVQQSIRYAWRGVRHVYRHEQNFRIQVSIGVLVIALMFVFGLNRLEKVVILLLVISVLSLELLNSALEKFIDVMKPRLHSQVEVVKDIMAAVVLCTSAGALLIGVLLFWPHVVEFIERL